MFVEFIEQSLLFRQSNLVGALVILLPAGNPESVIVAMFEVRSCDIKGEFNVSSGVCFPCNRFDPALAVVGAAIEAGLDGLSILSIDDDGDRTGNEDVESAMEDGIFSDGGPVAWVGGLLGGIANGDGIGGTQQFGEFAVFEGLDDERLGAFC